MHLTQLCGKNWGIKPKTAYAINKPKKDLQANNQTNTDIWLHSVVAQSIN